MSEQDVVKKLLDNLRKYLRSKNQGKCLETIGIIAEYFDGILTSPQIKYSIELLLRWDDQKISILKFLASSMQLSKTDKFSDCNKKIFELIQSLAKRYAGEVKLYSNDIVNACIVYLQSKQITAFEKECAAQTIHDMVCEEALSENVDLGKLINDVMSLFEQKNPTMRLQQHIYELLGTLSKKHSNKFDVNKAVDLRNKMMNTIQTLFKDDKATSLILVSGAVVGLKNHLVNFTPTPEQDPQFSQKLYECMVELSNPDRLPSNATNNRVAFRNMLMMIQQYGGFHEIPDLLFRDYKMWHKVLNTWISSKSYDDKNAGVQATGTFHIQIARVLEQRCSNEHTNVLLFFMKYFEDTLKSPESQPHEIRIAICGFGCMSVACRLLLEQKYLSERFDLVMQRVEYSYHTKDRLKRREVLEHLPYYVESLSRIMNELTEISGIQLQSLESVVVILIKDFHYLSTAYHTLVSKSLLKSFSNLEKLGEKKCENVLESVIWQGVLWTCSHQLVYDLQENLENVKDWKETVTYRSYLPLWEGLLMPDEEAHLPMSKKIYSYFIRDLFQIIEKLDLSTKKRKFYDETMNVDKEFFFSDPSLDLEPVRAQNFHLLYNLVQFYGDVILKQSDECLRTNFLEWIEFWLENSILLFVKHPLVSGFLQLLEISLKVMKRLDFGSGDDANELKIIENLSFFIKSMLLSRCPQMSGELQIACLQVVFQVPTVILTEYSEEATQIFTIGFSVGKSLLSVANLALTCFERFVDSLADHPKTRRKILEEVLPSLESFLSSSDSSETEVVHYKRGGRRKKTFIQTSVETDLMRFKKRILLFLGNFDPDEAQLVLSKFEQKLVRDHITNVFQVKLECDEEKIALIFLDDIVGRVSQLAVSSSERATKISACELLHSLVLYMMGKNLDGPDTIPLWKCLCNNLFILGADRDQTVRQLFEPLLMQMMHYFAQPSKILSPMASALMESLMTMICYRENSGVQDISARLLREFILWLNKGTDRNQRMASPVKLVNLFQDMKKMSIESDASRRLGATLAFNNVYRIIREDDSLIDVYWIYLLDVFGTNFKCSEDFSAVYESNFIDNRRFEQVLSSMDHLTRVFVERSDIFHRSNSDRIKPAGFEGITLTDVLKWLFKESGSLQYHYRHKSMEMFIKISPECGTKEEIFEQILSLDKILLVGEANGIAKHPDLGHLKNCQEPIFKEVYNWMQLLLKSLDFYIWIFQNEIIPQAEITEFLHRSVMLHSMSFFISSCVGKNMIELVSSINEALINPSMMSYETRLCNRNLDNIDSIRCIIVVRIIDLLTILMKENIAQFLNDSKIELMKITTQLMFKPSRLNFDCKSKNSLLELPNRLTFFVKSVTEHAPFDFRNSLMNKLQTKLIKYLNETYQSYEKLISKGTIDRMEINKLNGIDLMISKMKELLSLDFLAQEVLCKTADVLLKKVFDVLTEVKAEIRRPKNLSPSTKAFMVNVLSLCLKIDAFLAKIIDFLFNDTKLKISDSCFVPHGEHFLQVFSHSIYELFTTMLTATIRLLVAKMHSEDGFQMKIITILTELNGHIFKHHKDKQELLEENIQAMISEWPTILRFTLEMDNNLNCVDLAIINLVLHLAMTSPIEHLELGQRLEKFQPWLLALLENRENSVELKTKAIFLLPCITSRDEKTNEKLMKALNSVQQKHMPLRSHEFPESSLERAGLVAMTKALFVALLRSRSPVIYRFLINATIADDNYILESKLQQVQLDFMESLTPPEQEVIMSQTFDAFINGGFSPEVRLNFMSRFLLTIMKNGHVDVVMTFVRQKMNMIWNLTESSLNSDTENAFVNRCGGYMIFEAFVASVPKERIEKESFSYAGRLNNGATMIKDFIKKANDVRKDVIFIVDDPVRQELLRKFQCYCYRALAATVSNHKDNPELYNLTMFKETPKSGFIWQKLIDIRNDNLYSNWTQDFQEMPSLKEYVVSVKSLVTGASQTKYIETVSIFDDSLSQSLTKTDLSYSVVLSNREVLEREQRRRELEHQNTMKVQLESTPVNDHEVMSVLVGVVNHIHQNKISPFLDLERVEPKKYEWVVSLAASMKNRENHKNIRIFLAKLVDNCRNVFVYYAKQLLGAVMSVIVDGCVGDVMNFFITDLVTMLLSWSHVYKPTEMSEKQDACALLKFLMENAHNDREEIFKLNLELIKKVVETWKEILAEKIPTQTLLDLLHKPIEQENNHKLRCGIQLNAVVLANDLVPWNTIEQRDVFIKAIVGCFDNANVQVYQSGAQLLGMCLNKIIGEAEIQEDDDNFEIVDRVTKKLERIQKKAGSDVNVFLQLLYGIQKNFPRILDPFMTLIKYRIPKAVRKIKCIYLEMFLSRLEIEGENVFREIISIGVKDLLKQKEYQLLALHIINKALENLKANEIDDLMSELSVLMNSPRDEVRRILFEMMIFVVEKFRNDKNFDKKKPMRIILKGFTDSDPMVQNRVANFFSIEGELPKTFLGRFQELLENYYDPSVEKEFLHYTTQLLLDISIRHPRSQKPLLDYDPTKNREFFEYTVTTKSSSQRSLPPMFIESQHRQLLAGDGSIYDQLVRATQLTGSNQMFSPTQDPIKMSQVSQTFSFNQTQNSLFFSLKPQFLDKRSKTFSQSVTEELDIEDRIARDKEKTKPNALDYLRQRIVRKDDRGRSKEYALKAIDKKNFYEAARKNKERQSREGKEVVLYRRYRLGELPDFFFNSLAILMPLQALSKKDDAVAREVFISIFQSIIEILKESEDESEKNFFTSINKSILKILQQTRNSDSFLIETLIEMTMKSGKYLEISPNVVANVAMMNNMLVTGALFLESQIKFLEMEPGSDEMEDEPTSKRQKMEKDDTKINHWLKLIDLNYKLSEYETTVGIFTEKLNLEPNILSQLVTAIDFESIGQFIDASKIYQQLIVNQSARNTNEKEFYYQSFFSCLANLSDWREITKEIRNQFNSYDDVWDEDTPFHKETLLPHLLKSELRLILNENIDDEFLKILEEWMNNEDKCQYLRNVFPEEITMLHIVDTKFAEGSVEAEKALRNFGEEWNSVEMLDEKLKCLKNARTMAELSNFVGVITATSMDNPLKKLYRNWRLSKPKTSDSLVHWGDLVAYRKSFHSLIPEDRQSNSLSYLLDINQNLLNVAFAQKNCDAAKFIINDLKDHITETLSEDAVLKCNLALGKYIMMKVEKMKKPFEGSDETLGTQWMKLCQGLNKLVVGVIRNDGKKHPSIMVETLCCSSEITWKLWKIYEQCRADDVEIPDDYQQPIINLTDAIQEDGFDLAEHLLRHSENSIKSARRWAQKFLDEGATDEKETLLGTTYLKMGQFYQKVYENKTVTSQQIQSKMMHSVFCAIAYGSIDAKLYIPYVLQLSELKNNNLTKSFNEELNMVPKWMFISYISQMLSNYDFEEDCYLDELLLKLAVKYPNGEFHGCFQLLTMMGILCLVTALYFPFKLARNLYRSNIENRGMEKQHVTLMNNAVSSRIMDEFTMAVQCLVLPEKMLLTHFQRFKHFIDTSGSSMNNEKFEEAVKRFNNEVFKNNREKQGSAFLNINKEFKGRFQNLQKMNWNNQKLTIIQEIGTLQIEIRKRSSRRVSSFELHKLCNWMAEYNWSGDKDFIEIPGQYTGDEKPFAEQHVKIVRFEHRLKVFTSVQSPIEIKMYGSNGKTYSFIIKYGEDLRQDQRIQQIQDLMSRQLSKDRNCKQNHLRIQTYDVIPINSVCGMLSVVQDATTINDYLQEASRKFMVKTYSEFVELVRSQFRDFLLGRHLFRSWDETYERAIMERSREQLAEQIAARESMFPKDILQKSLLNSAISLETYYILRKNFVTSLVTMNIVHWVLGIGDRHLSNILIDIKSGTLIGIDFGVAFGAAANLSIPETVPFRLTSHFVHVLEPMGIAGMITKNMVHALRCFRDNSPELLMCLEMFVKEPTMDWLMRAKLKSVENDGFNTSTSSDWNPKARIEIVRRKLEGANPVKVLQDELEISQVAENRELLERYKELTSGSEGSLRRQMNTEGLTPAEQVSCLNDMATDKALLASMYLGWDPWI